MSVRRALLVVSPFLLTLSSTVGAEEPTPGYHPWANDHVGPMQIDAADMVAHPERYKDRVVPQPDVRSLDEWKAEPGQGQQARRSEAGQTPPGWVQRGNVVLPTPVANGELVDPDVIAAAEDIPGNEYPRKHTLFINFNGGMLFSGADNSAENRSTLARQGVYPTYEGGEAKAVSIVQAVQDDVARYGIVVTYLTRPSNTVPYTMEMVGGTWMDTNIDSAAGGVAPGADCGALGQRHVVYTFASGGASATSAANTASQEAGHAWGLDHTSNCGSVMSYCGGGDGNFSDTCDPLCESLCQGPNSAGCRLTHEEFCGEGAEAQNEDAELTWIFGGNEPDMEAPSVEIVSPEDGAELEDGADVDIRSLISDNYGGYGWYYHITLDGAEVASFVDYDRLVDKEFRPALNLTGLEPGEWVFTVGAEDHFGHVTEDSVTVFVGVPNDSGVDETGDEPGGTGVTTGDEPTTTSDLDEDMTDDKGCGCQATSSTPPGWSALLLLGVVALRRRRR